MFSLCSIKCVIRYVPFSRNTYSNEIFSYLKGTITNVPKISPLILDKEKQSKRGIESGERKWAHHEVGRLIRTKRSKETVDRGGVAESRSQI